MGPSGKGRGPIRTTSNGLPMHYHVTLRRSASPPRHHLHPAAAASTPPLAHTRARARRLRKPKLAKPFRLFILCPASTYITLTVPCHPTASRAPPFLSASDSTPPPSPVPPPPPAPTHSIGTSSVCYCPLRAARPSVCFILHLFTSCCFLPIRLHRIAIQFRTAPSSLPCGAVCLTPKVAR